MASHFDVYHLPTEIDLTAIKLLCRSLSGIFSGVQRPLNSCAVQLGFIIYIKIYRAVFKNPRGYNYHSPKIYTYVYITSKSDDTTKNGPLRNLCQLSIMIYEIFRFELQEITSNSPYFVSTITALPWRRTQQRHLKIANLASSPKIDFWVKDIK